MEFSFTDNLPIYIQLVEQIKINIISGNLASGERLPSVRDLALQTKVNPNTMQKALSELENMGLIYTERTNGKFVTEDKELILRYKNEYANDMVQTFFNNMKKIGYTKPEAIQYLTKAGGNE